MILGGSAIRVVVQRVEATLSRRGLNLAGRRRRLDGATARWRPPARMICPTPLLRSNTRMSFADLYARHAIASFDKQVYLEAMLGRKRRSSQ